MIGVILSLLRQGGLMAGCQQGMTVYQQTLTSKSENRFILAVTA